MDKKVKNIVRTGYASKGLVYALTGFLAISAAFGLGAQSEGKLGVLKFLQDQPFGNILLGILGLGLFCYSFWRFYQSVVDPENIGSDGKGMGKRIGFFFSGLLYLGLGVYAFYQIFNPSSSGGSSGKSMIPNDYLDYIFYAVAIGMALKAIFQWKKVYDGDFLKKFHLDTMSNINTRKTVKYLGYAGLIARGIVVAIIAYFFFRAAGTAGSEDIKGTKEAFSFLRQSSGPILVAMVAFGLLCYGAYMFIMAKYRSFKDI